MPAKATAAHILNGGAPQMDSRLDEMRPDWIAGSEAGKRQHKSSTTRLALLEAAVDVLAEQGYARTTTPVIAQRAGMSRGAMLHHYATKRDLIDGVIDYICFKRLDELVSDIRRLSDRERVDDLAGLNYMWQSLLGRKFQAFLELQIAARTDLELRELFEPKARHYYRVEHEVCRSIFPEYGGDWHRLDVSIDFCRATLQGLLLNLRIFQPEARETQVRQLFAATIDAFRRGELEPAPRVTSLAAGPAEAGDAAYGRHSGAVTLLRPHL